MSPSMIPADPTSVRAPVHEGRPKGDRQRQLLLALVAANPGVHILRAAALLGLNWNTCLHHVRRLEGAGTVTVRKVNGRVCLFDRKAGAASNRIGNLLLRDERNVNLAKLLIGSPGVNQKSLAGHMGVAASVVHYRLVRLEEAGLIQRVNRGREVCVFPTESLEAAFRATQVPGPLMPATPEVEPEALAETVPDLAATAPGLLAAAALPTPFDVDAPVASP
ncbi:MAG: winged helix-turn-helix transcriptional regulator [Thermoplasmatota archaeon]|nr:winged helix-turn-helix transcriptional regulator [Halobacteriales archaeon]